jgi:hypothetical protein
MSMKDPKRRLAKLYIDQSGLHVWARNLSELCAQVSYARSTARRMYCDDPVTKQSYHTGYVIGRHWFSEFTPTRKELLR